MGYVACLVRYISSGQYICVRFVSGIIDRTPSVWATLTGFTFAVSSLPVFDLSSSCPGPTVVSAPTYISLTNSSYYDNNMDCSVVLSASSGSVLLTVSSFSTFDQADVLQIFDGPSSSSPLLAAMSGMTAYSSPHM